MDNLLVGGVGTAGEDDLPTMAARTKTRLLGYVNTAPLDVLLQNRTLVRRWQRRVAVAEEADSQPRRIDECLDVREINNASRDPLGRRKPTNTLIRAQARIKVRLPERQQITSYGRTARCRWLSEFVPAVQPLTLNRHVPRTSTSPPLPVVIRSS